FKDLPFLPDRIRCLSREWGGLFRSQIRRGPEIGPSSSLFWILPYSELTNPDTNSVVPVISAILAIAVVPISISRVAICVNTPVRPALHYYLSNRNRLGSNHPALG